MLKTLHDVLMNDVDMSAICRYIKDQGLTWRKLCLAAAQRDELLKLQYSTDFFVYECEMLTLLMKRKQTKEISCVNMRIVFVAGP